MFKYIVLISFQKLIEFSDADHLSKKLDLQFIATFISKLTTFNDIMVVAITLIITELLVTKIPEAYIVLTREGVIDFIKSLSSISEAAKLEAYSIIPKRYNPLETLKQFTANLSRLAPNSGAPNELLANLEAESQRLETIMQQLQGLKNPESPSDSHESKTLSSGEEISPAKSPSITKSIIHTLQNIPKSNSLENKLITGLNKKPSDEIIEEEVPSEKPAPQIVDKVTELRREVSAFAIEIYNSMKESIQKKNLPYMVPSTIINKLEEISLSFEQNQWNSAEFGQKHFQKYLDLLNEHGRVTNYELKSSKILTHLLNFLFDNILETKSAPNSAEPISATQPKETNFKKLKNIFKEEEKKTNSIPNEADKNNLSEKKPAVEITEQQCRTILGRIISFLYYFKKVKCRTTQEIYLQDFLKNLQEMLTTSDHFSLDVARNYQEYENTLSSGKYFLHFDINI